MEAPQKIENSKKKTFWLSGSLCWTGTKLPKLGIFHYKNFTLKIVLFSV